jgi:hypothetical protein
LISFCFKSLAIAAGLFFSLHLLHIKLNPFDREATENKK